MKTLHTFLIVITYSWFCGLALAEQATSEFQKPREMISLKLNALSLKPGYEDVINDHYNRFHALSSRKEFAEEFLPLCRLLSETSIEPAMLFTMASDDKGKQLVLILAMVDVNAEQYITFGDYLLEQVLNGHLDQEVFIRHYLLANANKKQFFFSMNYQEPEVRTFIQKVKSKIISRQLQEWAEGVLSGEYAKRDRINFFDKRPQASYNEIDHFDRDKRTIKSTHSVLGGIKTGENSSEMTIASSKNEPAAFTLRSVIVVLIVVAAGLLWLLLKGRK
jgi:hypothetical protein